MQRYFPNNRVLLYFLFVYSFSLLCIVVYIFRDTCTLNISIKRQESLGAKNRLFFLPRRELPLMGGVAIVYESSI